jgi:hypothetical protein
MDLEKAASNYAALSLMLLSFLCGCQASLGKGANADRPRTDQLKSDQLDRQGYKIRVNQPGAQLYLKSLDSASAQGAASQSQSGGKQAYLQVVDLRKMTLEQVLGDLRKPGTGQGIYYQGETKFPSPFFQNLLFSDVQQQTLQRLKSNKASSFDRLFSIFNGAFFEQHEASTQLAFPLKHRGTVVSGGNSPYGPRQSPGDAQFKDVQLLALSWKRDQVAIGPYHPTSGTPLTDKTIAEAVVSYDYRDHPAYRYSKDSANRFHLLGTIDADGKPGDELLLIVTVNLATLDQAAALLRELGVTGSIMTIDGGASTYLFTPKLGALTIPAPTQKASRQLPHYFVIRQRF